MQSDILLFTLFLFLTSIALVVVSNPPGKTLHNEKFTPHHHRYENYISKHREILQNSKHASYIPFLKSLHDWLQNSEFEKSRLVVSLLNKIWIDRLGEFVVSMTNATNMAVVIIALDSQTYELCSSYGVPSIDFYSLYEGVGIGELVMRGKFEVVHHLLLTGYNVFFMEMDLFLNQATNFNFSQWFHETNEIDMLFSQHDYHPELNIGFFYLKSSLLVLETFTRVFYWISDENNRKLDTCGAIDQKVLDYAVRGEGQLEKPCNGTNLNILSDTFTRHANWTYVPYEMVAHPPISASVLENAVFIHLWSGMGTIISRYIYACNHGYWNKAVPCIDSTETIITGAKERNLIISDILHHSLHYSFANGSPGNLHHERSENLP